MNENRKIRCDFCGKKQEEVDAIIVSPMANICDNCVQVCLEVLRKNGIIEDENSVENPKKSEKPETKIGWTDGFGKDFYLDDFDLDYDDIEEFDEP